MKQSKRDRLIKVLGSRAEELDASSKEQLEAQIVQSQKNIEQIVDELEANPKYQELKEALKEVSASARDAKKFQKAITEYCVMLLTQSE